MSTITAPQEDIATILLENGPQPPRKCHTVDGRGWALCGAFGPSPDRKTHSRKECRGRGHRHCVLCDELGRQLSGDRIVVA